MRRDIPRDIAKKRYLDALKLLPDLSKRKTRTYVELSLTMVALIILGIFAISPTLATITQLQKQIEDSKFVNASLTQKISNLSQLQQQYVQLGNDIPRVVDAIPEDPKAPYLLGQLQTIAEQADVRIVSLQTSPVEIISISGTANVNYSYILTTNIEGQYDAFEKFLTSLASFDRIVSIEGLTITTNPNNKTDLVISIKLRTYFKPGI